MKDVVLMWDNLDVYILYLYAHACDLNSGQFQNFDPDSCIMLFVVANMYHGDAATWILWWMFDSEMG